MFPKDRIPVLIVRLPHLSFPLTNGIIPRIAPCLMPIRSCAPVVMSMVVRPVVVVWLSTTVGMVRRVRERRGMAGLGAAHCDGGVYSILRK